MSACIAAQQLKERPDNDYLSISQMPIQRTLPVLAKIHPRFAEATFRQACQLPPLPRSQTICNWLKRERAAMAPILDIDLRTAPLEIFDLSVASPLVHGDPEKNTEPCITKRLWHAMEAAGVKAAIGRYDEARMIYTSPLFVKGDGLGEEHRVVHIGMDFYAEAGCAVHAPIAGKVFAFSNNEAPQDYGPVVILEHATDQGELFYTLYGHLSTDTQEGLYAGKPIARGERFGRIGTADVNGAWTPHLHFQIITDLLDMGCDFPGVARSGERSLWTLFSPDPNLVIGIAGFIAETCPSVAGQIFLPEGYLPEVYRLVRKAGGLCIADEVQTGYGRIGTHFYAFEAENLVPDIVVLGKPIGNGYPLSAVVTTPEIADAFDTGMEFFSTFGGNTVSCAVGLTVLEVVLEENLQANALKVGKRLLEGMAPFIERYPIVGDIRGSGLFLGVEMVRSRETLKPAKEEADFIVNRMRDASILLGTDGPFDNVIKIRPPMPFDESNADFLVANMDRILREDFLE